MMLPLKPETARVHPHHIQKTAYIVVAGIGLDELSAFGSMNVFPNPTKGNLSIEGHIIQDQRVLIELFDLSGKKIATLVNTNSASGIQDWTFDLKEYVRETQTLVLSITIGETTEKGLIQFIK